MEKLRAKMNSYKKRTDASQLQREERSRRTVKLTNSPHAIIHWLNLVSGRIKGGFLIIDSGG